MGARYGRPNHHARILGPHDTDVDDAPGRAVTTHGEHDVEPGHDLAVDGFPGQSGQRAQGLQASRERRHTVCVDRASAGVPDIECGKELTDLRSANLPHDQPVRPHPQGLPDQVGHGDQAVSLDIRRAALEMHHVTMRWTQLGDILDEHDSLVGRAEGDQPAEQGGLARPGAATHEEGALAGHHGHENRGHRLIDHAQPDEIVDPGRRHPRDAQTHMGATPHQGGQHGVQAYAAGQVDVGPWLGIVEAASTEPRQSDRQGSQLPLRHPDAGQFHPLPAIHPDPTVTVDEDLAILTGRLSGIRTLKAQGVEKIVFVTKGATSAFLLSDLLDKGEGGEAYRLTHNGKAVTFTLGESMADVSAILIKP